MKTVIVALTLSILLLGANFVPAQEITAQAIAEAVQQGGSSSPMPIPVPASTSLDSRKMAWLLERPDRFEGMVRLYHHFDQSNFELATGLVQIRQINDVWYFTRLTLNGDTIISEKNPQPGFPLGFADGGWISDFWIMINGINLRGDKVCQSFFQTQTLGISDPINFVIHPKDKYVFEPYDLGDYDPSGLYAVIRDSRGGWWTLYWDQSIQGFGIWFDPEGEYTWEVWYNSPDGKKILVKSPEPLQDPSKKTPLNPVNMAFVGNVEIPEFNGWWWPDPRTLNGNAVVDGIDHKAYCAKLDLNGYATVVHLYGFWGKVEVRRADDPNHNPLWDSPTCEYTVYEQKGDDWGYQRLQIPAGIGTIVFTAYEDFGMSPFVLPYDPDTLRSFGIGFERGETDPGKG